MVLPLNKVFGRYGHIVAEIIEAEFVVGAEGYVAVISIATGIGIGLVLVDAVYRKAVELIQRTHPLAVSLAQIVVHGYYMNALAGKCIKEYGQSCHEGFAFTCAHFCNPALMQSDAADKLNIIMHHVPSDFVAAGNPALVPDGFVAFYAYKVVTDAELFVEFACLDYNIAVIQTTGSGLHY